MHPFRTKNYSIQYVQGTTGFPTIKLGHYVCVWSYPLLIIVLVPSHI